MTARLRGQLVYCGNRLTRLLINMLSVVVSTQVSARFLDQEVST